MPVSVAGKDSRAANNGKRRKHGHLYCRVRWVVSQTRLCSASDARPTDDAAERIELSLDTIMELLKFIFGGFLDYPEAEVHLWMVLG